MEGTKAPTNETNIAHCQARVMPRHSPTKSIREMTTVHGVRAG